MLRILCELPRPCLCLVTHKLVHLSITLSSHFSSLLSFPPPFFPSSLLPPSFLCFFLSSYSHSLSHPRWWGTTSCGSAGEFSWLIWCCICSSSSPVVTQDMLAHCTHTHTQMLTEVVSLVPAIVWAGLVELCIGTQLGNDAMQVRGQPLRMITCVHVCGGQYNKKTCTCAEMVVWSRDQVEAQLYSMTSKIRHMHMLVDHLQGLQWGCPWPLPVPEKGTWSEPVNTEKQTHTHIIWTTD